MQSRSHLAALFLLLSPAFCLAQPGTTRGELLETRDLKTLILRDDAGRERPFEMNSGTRCWRGTRHHIEIDRSRLLPGSRLRIEHEGERAQVIYEDWRWYEYGGLWFDERMDDFKDWSADSLGAEGLFSTRNAVVALVSSILVALVCGLVSSMVVTNRMAFFSDALAHCAFAGVALGWILRFAGAASGDSGILTTMVIFGVLVGVAIAFVREQTSLANDTVIGVFFAGSMGLGAVLLTGIGSTGSGFSPENFVFGDPQGANGQDMVYMLCLLVGIGVLFGWQYNRMVFASFNPSLARSRNFPVRLGNYLFIILLGLIVNLCLKTVGALLISALLVVPAASAANVSRNLRQFFWLSVLLSMVPAVAGWWICQRVVLNFENRPIYLGSGGVTVVVGVIIFFVSMALSRWVRGARTAARTSF